MKKLFSFSALILASLFVHAQTQSGSVSDIQNSRRNQPNQTTQNEQEGGFRKENLRFGGNLGLQWGRITFIDVSPTVGYQFTNRLLAGLGVTYNYYRERWYDINSERQQFVMNVTGGSVFTQFAVVQLPSMRLFLRAEYSLLRQSLEFSYQPRFQTWEHYPLLGGGILLPLGRSGGLSAQLMWDLVEKEFSIHPRNPIIRIGFMFGL